MLPLDIDPKLAWALRHRDRFPLDVNSASREELLRVPGFGTKAVDRIIATRRVDVDPRRRPGAAAHSAEQGAAVHRSQSTTAPRRICSMARGSRSGSGRRRSNSDLGFEKRHTRAVMRGAAPLLLKDEQAGHPRAAVAWLLDDGGECQCTS